MPTYGPYLASSGADDAAVGNIAWGNPGNITVADDVYATALMDGLSGISHYLRAAFSGLSAIPDGEISVGVTVAYHRVRGAGGGSGALREHTVQLRDDTSALVGTNKADTGTNWAISGEEEKIHGGPADTWGWAGITTAKIKHANFAVMFAANGATAGSTREAWIDDISITIETVATPSTLFPPFPQGRRRSPLIRM